MTLIYEFRQDRIRMNLNTKYPD